MNPRPVRLPYEINRIVAGRASRTARRGGRRPRHPVGAGPLRIELRLGASQASAAAFNGGYASRENLKRATEMGVAHAAFSKKRGLTEENMTSSPWIFDRLRCFRAGVEADIS